jgi:hypothetical protein
MVTDKPTADTHLSKLLATNLTLKTKHLKLERSDRKNAALQDRPVAMA